MSRATDKTLDGLHGLMAEAQAEELRRNLERSRLPVTDENYQPLSPKLLAVIRAFLKDNGIDAPASSPRFDSLISELEGINVDDPSVLAN